MLELDTRDAIAFYCLAISCGLCSASDARSWVDEQIMVTNSPEMWMIEVSESTDPIRILREMLPPNWDMSLAYRLCMSRLADLRDRKVMTDWDAARRLSHIADSHDLPDDVASATSKIQVLVYQLEDADDFEGELKSAAGEIADALLPFAQYRSLVPRFGR